MPSLLDANVITQLLKRNARVIHRYRTVLEQGQTVYLSVVVYYQVKRGLLHLGGHTSTPAIG